MHAFGGQSAFQPHRITLEVYVLSTIGDQLHQTSSHLALYTPYQEKKPTELDDRAPNNFFCLDIKVMNAGAVTSGAVHAIHLAIVAAVVAVPFLGNTQWLALHAVFVPFLWLHWALNNDTCALTLLERTIRGVPESDSFVHRIVSPLFKLGGVSDRETRRAVWWASLALWLVTMARLQAAK